MDLLLHNFNSYPKVVYFTGPVRHMSDLLRHQFQRRVRRVCSLTGYSSLDVGSAKRQLMADGLESLTHALHFMMQPRNTFIHTLYVQRLALQLRSKFSPKIGLELLERLLSSPNVTSMSSKRTTILRYLGL